MRLVYALPSSDDDHYGTSIVPKRAGELSSRSRLFISAIWYIILSRKTKACRGIIIENLSRLVSLPSDRMWHTKP